MNFDGSDNRKNAADYSLYEQYGRRNYDANRVGRLPMTADWNRNSDDNKGDGPYREDRGRNDFGPTGPGGPIPPTPAAPSAAARPLPQRQEPPLEAPPFRRIGYPKREPATRPGRRR